MKAVIQRVKRTALYVDGKLISEIPFGLAVFLGVKAGDSELAAQYVAKKNFQTSHFRRRDRQNEPFRC